MRRAPWSARAFALGLASTLAISGCHCGRKSDEEVLRERIDTTKVHLYIATKIAVTKVDSSPEVAEARKQLLAILAVLEKATAGAPSTVPAASAAPTVAPVASTVPAVAPVASAAPPAAPGLGAGDYAKLAVALWKLRAEGKAVLRSGGEDKLAPVLPVLLRDSGMPEETIALFDTNTEHALFLTVLFLLRLDDRSPVPVPDEIVLYEVWATRADAIRLQGFAPLVQAVKAAAYGANELCDLSAKEAARADATAGDTAAAVESSRRLAGGQGGLSAEQAEKSNAAARTIGHGYAGICYLGRSERKLAAGELDSAVKAAHDMGVPPGETAMLRAYIAFEKGDHDAAKKALEDARDYPGTDADTRNLIEETLPRLAKNDDGAIRKTFSKAYLGLFAVKLIHRQLAKAGVYDALADAPPVRKLRDFTQATTGAVGDAKKAIPSVGDVKAKGAELREKLVK